MAPYVLIVDDNVSLAGLLGTLAQEAGLEPILAHTGEDALVLFGTYEPAAVILDLLLPDLSGHRLLDVLRQRRLPPLFVITGIYKGAEQQHRLRSMVPLAGFFEKPFDERTLIAQVVEAIGNQALPPPSDSWPRISTPTPTPTVNPAPAQLAKIKVKKDDSGRFRRSPSRGGPNWSANWDPNPPVSPRRGRSEPALRAQEPAAFHETTPVLPQLSRPRTLTDDLVLERGRAEGRPPSPSGEHRYRPAETLELDEPLWNSEGSFGSNPTGGLSLESALPEALRFSRKLRATLGAGDVEMDVVPRLFYAFHLAEESGRLIFEQSGKRRWVDFSKGSPVYAAREEAGDLCDLARRAALLTHPQAERARAFADGNRLSEALIDLGDLSEEQCEWLLMEHATETINELFGWTEGRFFTRFKEGRPSGELRLEDQISEQIGLTDSPAALIMNGIKANFGITRLRRLVPDQARPKPSATARHELHELPIEENEAPLVLRATGARTVAQLIQELAPMLNELGVRAHLAGLLTVGVLKV